MSLDGKTEELRTLEVGYWIYLFAIVVIGHLGVAYLQLTHVSQYTYFNNQIAPSATVFSERWDLQWFFQGSLIFLWLVTFSAAFMMGYYRLRWPKILHIIVTTILIIWFLVMIGFSVYYLIKANDPAFPNNPANDIHYCCVYGAIHPECPNNPSGSTCPFIIGSGDLKVNGDFLIDFWFKIVYAIFMIIDIIFAMLYIRWARQTMIEYITVERKRTKSRRRFTDNVDSNINNKVRGSRKNNNKGQWTAATAAAGGFKLV